MNPVKLSHILDFFQTSLQNQGLEKFSIATFNNHFKNLSEVGISNMDFIIISDEFNLCDFFYRPDLTRKAELSTIKKFCIPIETYHFTPEEFFNIKKLVNFKSCRIIYENIPEPVKHHEYVY